MKNNKMINIDLKEVFDYLRDKDLEIQDLRHFYNIMCTKNEKLKKNIQNVKDYINNVFAHDFFMTDLSIDDIIKKINDLLSN